MTELSPNDLSHMSDEDFNALCPQGHHAPGAEPLSHAAQAVLDAAINTPEDSPYEYDIAAALRAAADQARSQKIMRSDWVRQTWILQDDLLAIAAELEGQ